MIPDDLYRQVKAKAALEGKKVTELVEEGLRVVLGIASAPGPRAGAYRITLPMIAKKPGQGTMFADMTPEEIHRRLSQLLMEDAHTDGRASDESSV